MGYTRVHHVEGHEGRGPSLFGSCFFSKVKKRKKNQHARREYDIFNYTSSKVRLGNTKPFLIGILWAYAIVILPLMMFQITFF